MRRKKNQTHKNVNEIVLSYVKRITRNTERNIYLSKIEQPANREDGSWHDIRISWCSRVDTRQDKAGHRTGLWKCVASRCLAGARTRFHHFLRNFLYTVYMHMPWSTPLSEHSLNFVAELNPIAPSLEPNCNYYILSSLIFGFQTI